MEAMLPITEARFPFAEAKLRCYSHGAACCLCGRELDRCERSASEKPRCKLTRCRRRGSPRLNADNSFKTQTSGAFPCCDSCRSNQVSE
eukprot:2142614-Rhodomonas_salina.2